MSAGSTTRLACLLVIVPLAAQAQGAAPLSGLYVSVAGGDNFLQSLYTHPTLSPRSEPGSRYRFDNGYVVAGSVGYGLGNGIRVEVEGAYDYNNVINRARTPVATRTNGNQNTFGVLGNVFYDLDLTKLGTDITFVQPYVGLGAGVLWTRLRTSSAALDGNDVFVTGGTGANFAAQAVVGLGFPIKSVPGLKFNVDYRFIGITGTSGLASASYTPAGLSTGSTHVSPPFLHQIAFSLAYAFNHPASPVPESAAPPAAPSVSSRSYLVFFDWNSAALTDRARQIVREAAQASTRVLSTRIEVDGYTDRSGTASYNQALSMHRAATVAAELARQGVPPAAISLHGFGEARPLVPTADGVREAQNRRVEIVLR